MWVSLYLCVFEIIHYIGDIVVEVFVIYKNGSMWLNQKSILLSFFFKVIQLNLMKLERIFN